MGYNHFYDQILEQIEAGHVHDGVMQLAGMLDALARDGERFEGVKAEFHQHLLFELLMQHPTSGFAAGHPRKLALFDLIAAETAPEGTSSTGKRLFAVTSQMGFARAIRDQEQRLRQTLIRAWQQGKQIALLGESSLLATVDLSDRDVSNIECSSAAVFFASTHRNFDLIIIADIAEVFDEDCLGSFFARVPVLMTEQSSLQMASLSPGHSGAGWLDACLGVRPTTMGDAGLNQCAARHGLSITSYRDASGCLIISDLSLSASMRPGGVKP